MTVPSVLPAFKTANWSTRDAVFSILSRRWPLSAKQIFQSLKTDRGFSSTYQSVHKLLLDLCGEGVLEKKDRAYQIAPAWIKSIKSFGENLDASYSSLKGVQSLGGTNTVNFSFSRFIDFGKFIINVFHEEFPNPEKKICVCFLNHTYGPIGLDETDIKHLEEIYRRVTHYAVITNNTLLDRYFSEGMAKLGKHCIVGIEPPSQADILTNGDYICQVYYDPKFKKKFDAIYEHTKDMGSAEFIDFFRLYQEPFITKVVVSKNPELSEFFRNWMLRLIKNDSNPVQLE